MGRYDQEEFEGIGEVDKPGHSMKDDLIIQQVRVLLHVCIGPRSP